MTRDLCTEEEEAPCVLCVTRVSMRAPLVFVRGQKEGGWGMPECERGGNGARPAQKDSHVSRHLLLPHNHQPRLFRGLPPRKKLPQVPERWAGELGRVGESRRERGEEETVVLGVVVTVVLVTVLLDTHTHTHTRTHTHKPR